MPADSDATTRTTLTGVGSKRGGKLVKRIACRRARKQKSEAECIAARHAERDLNKRMNRDADTRLAQANERYRKEFLEPVGDRGLMPQSLRFRSSRKAIHITGLRARSFELAAPGPPPTAAEGSDMAVRVHESMVNNMGEAAAAGMIVKEKQLRSEVERLLGEVPKALEPDDDSQPWGITFSSRQPVSVVFGDNRFTVIVRGRAYDRGNTRYPIKMDITADYRIENTENGPTAVREGELKIFPPGFDPEGTARLGGRQTALRRLLARRFGKIFEDRITPEDLELPGNWSKAGNLKLVQWETQDGWMVLAWNRVPSTEAVAATVGAQ
jgi:hypothetical protein